MVAKLLSLVNNWKMRKRLSRSNQATSERRANLKHGCGKFGLNEECPV